MPWSCSQDLARAGFRTGRGGRIGTVAAGAAACTTVRPARLSHPDVDGADRRRRHGQRQGAFLMIRRRLRSPSPPSGRPTGHPPSRWSAACGSWPAECADRAPVRRRDAGRDDRHSHRQDLDPDGRNHMTVRRFWVASGEVDASGPASWGQSSLVIAGSLLRSRCHVMERKSPEDRRPHGAHEQAVRVRRSTARSGPDVDALYMEAVQAMTGHGAAAQHLRRPSRSLFYGGTYSLEPRMGPSRAGQVLCAR